MTKTNAECRALLETAEQVLCDIDGCLIRGDAAIPGAVAFVESVLHKLVLVSNNSTDTAATMARRLAAMGPAVPPDRIYLAGEQTLLKLRDEFPDARLLLVATDAIRDRAVDLKLRIVTTQPDLIVLCRAPQASLGQVEAALEHAARGTPVLAANSDITHPGLRGPAIETGAVAALLRICHPTLLASFFGKPEPTLFLHALRGKDPSRAVMIGDNPKTDIAGAERIGMASILVHPDEKTGRTVADLALVRAM